jgi:hypothetical protein
MLFVLFASVDGSEETRMDLPRAPRMCCVVLRHASARAGCIVQSPRGQVQGDNA